MADSKQDNQPTPKPGIQFDTTKPGEKPATIHGTPDANKADADKAADQPADKSSPKNGGQGRDVPAGSETIPGGAYVVDGVVRNANGEELKDYKVGPDGAIVKA